MSEYHKPEVKRLDCGCIRNTWLEADGSSIIRIDHCDAHAKENRRR